MAFYYTSRIINDFIKGKSISIAEKGSWCRRHDLGSNPGIASHKFIFQPYSYHRNWGIILIPGKPFIWFTDEIWNEKFATEQILFVRSHFVVWWISCFIDFVSSFVYRVHSLWLIIIIIIGIVFPFSNSFGVIFHGCVMRCKVTIGTKGVSTYQYWNIIIVYMLVDVLKFPVDLLGEELELPPGMSQSNYIYKKKAMNTQVLFQQSVRMVG